MAGSPALLRLGEFVCRMLPALAIGYLIMGLLWPWSVVKPLNPLHAAEYFDTFFEKPWQRTLRGPADRRPRHAAQAICRICSRSSCR